MHLRKYCVHIPMLGVAVTGASKDFVCIPSGAILVTMPTQESQRGLYLRVQWNNRELLVFPQDVAARADQCELPPESPA